MYVFRALFPNAYISISNGVTTPNKWRTHSSCSTPIPPPFRSQTSARMTAAHMTITTAQRRPHAKRASRVVVSCSLGDGRKLLWLRMHAIERAGTRAAVNSCFVCHAQYIVGLQWRASVFARSRSVCLRRCCSIRWASRRATCVALIAHRYFNQPPHPSASYHDDVECRPTAMRTTTSSSSTSIDCNFLHTNATHADPHVHAHTKASLRLLLTTKQWKNTHIRSRTHIGHSEACSAAHSHCM